MANVRVERMKVSDERHEIKEKVRWKKKEKECRNERKDVKKQKKGGGK